MTENMRTHKCTKYIEKLANCSQFNDGKFELYLSKLNYWHQFGGVIPNTVPTTVADELKELKIEESDIMYKDDLVCILRPDVKKGIIVWSSYKQPPGMNSLCELGLKTGTQLKKEGVDFGRSTIHPYIFFRAPYYSRDIDYSTPETEIKSSYGDKQFGIEPHVFIRVDPDKTFVFSSEIRATLPSPIFHINGSFITKTELSSTHSKFFMEPTDEKYRELYNTYYNTEINKSKKTLSEYLAIIKTNENTPPYNNAVYNLHTSKKIGTFFQNLYPYDDTPIERNSEILVSIPHLTPNYFVSCTPTRP